MPAKSSTDIAETEAAESLPGSSRLLLLLLNWIPFLLLALLLVLLVAPAFSLSARIILALASLYLAPPLLNRLLFAIAPPAEGRLVLGSKSFFVWWCSLQLQMIFNRFPALEELLRLVPGLYSTWLRLWGARVGRLTFWAAGTMILDRPFLNIGDDVIFGAGVRLNAHVIAPNDSGKQELLLQTIRIGDRATIGGYSLLTAGTEIAPDETTRAFLISPPFSRWRKGKRLRES